MKRVQNWVKSKRRELQLAGLSLVAALLGGILVCWLFPSRALPQAQVLTFSQEEKQGSSYLSSATDPIAVEDLLSVELQGNETSEQMEGLTLEAFVQKFGPAQTFISEETIYASVITVGYGYSDTQSPYQMKFQKQGDRYVLQSIQAFAPYSKRYPVQSQLKKSDFAAFQTSAQAKQGSRVEDIFSKVGAPSSFSMRKVAHQQELAVTYRLQDGLMSLTFIRDTKGHYLLNKKG